MSKSSRRINRTLRKKAFKRDDFTCQKCKFQDKTAEILEVHHIILICAGGTDTIDNVITLCEDCHHFAPNNLKDFEEYMQEEMEGTLTTLIKSWKEVLEGHPELIDKLNENQQNERV